MQNQERFFILLSFAAIYFIWGSTYLFVAFAVEEFTPFLMAAIRFGFASSLLYLMIVLFRRKVKIHLRQFLNASLAGFLFLTLGMGCSSWALQHLDSGLTALLIAGQPLEIVLALWIVDRRRPKNQAFLGVFLGIFGMYLLVSGNEITIDPNQTTALLVILMGMTAWTIGSILVSRADMPDDQMSNNAIQMVMGSFFLLILSFLFEDPVHFSWTSVSFFAWGSMAYLIVFGSVLAFTAFNYLLSKVSPDKVATGSYVNPVVALFLGWMFREEAVTIWSILGAGIMLTGVYFINTNRVSPKVVQDES